MGGSTTYGRPYFDNVSFCGWLRAYLQAADPTRNWEVINAGGVSYASYRVAILMEELVEYDPDLFIVYSGHNEFLERRTYPQIIARKMAEGLIASSRGGEDKVGDVLKRAATTPGLRPVTLTPELLDYAVSVYFTVM